MKTLLPFLLLGSLAITARAVEPDDQLPPAPTGSRSSWSGMTNLTATSWTKRNGMCQTTGVGTVGGRRRPFTEEVACTDDVLIQSHVGGVPYAESGDEWPQGTPEGEPAKFMLQVQLDHPGLGDQWQGRLIVAFLVFDYEQAVRIYAAPSLEKYVALDAKRPPNPCILLKPVRLPAEVGEEGTVPMMPDRLCEDFPEITVPLEPYTKDFDGVLTQILRPNVYGYGLDAPDIAYVGGDPMLIQNPHDPVCDECGKPMRFLFQFGEVIPGVQMADGGVFYVYGCDDHPDCCKGFVDSH